MGNAKLNSINTKEEKVKEKTSKHGSSQIFTVHHKSSKVTTNLTHYKSSSQITASNERCVQRAAQVWRYPHVKTASEQ